jgi:hypothetical protein
MTTYAISLLLGRHFLINITKPCNLSDFLLPNEHDWSVSVPSLIAKRKLRPNFTSISYLTRNYGFYKAYNVTDVLNMMFTYWDVDVIYFQVNDNWLPFFQSDKTLRRRIAQLGYDPYNFRLGYLLKPWLKRLFRYSDTVKSEYEKHVPKLKPNNKTVLICAQIRTHDVPKKKNVFKATLFWDFIMVYYLSIMVFT